MSQEPFLSISEASHLLGVSEAALRQWTDEGKIKAFITPGGHRRYARAELRKLMSSQTKILGIKDLAAGLEETAGQHREISRASLKDTAWFNKLSEESQTHLAELGRQLLNLIIKYITEPSHREETIRMVREIGRNHGETLARSGQPLTDSVEAFLLHREPIMQAVAHLMRKREGVTGRIVEAIPMVARAMDEALTALVAAHQQHRNGVKTASTGGNSV
ncbi:MAG: helix-turn-helix domain-containing protein [Dehalococcoidales bacterium]|nr:helix-turn-helix domain-containing protein [Dehalococcoidales bacterium]